MSVLAICMYMCHGVQSLQSPERVGVPRTRGTAGWEPPYRFWGQNPSSLQEHQVPLTAEPCLQPLKGFHV